jgi:predicted ATP-dependent endonuclease of OLD family
MSINRVEIKDFLVFKGEFAVDFCPGVNVLIGANATGKTTLLKVMYAICEQLSKLFTPTISFSSGGWFDYFTGGGYGYHYTVDINQYDKIQIIIDEKKIGWLANQDDLKKRIKPTLDGVIQILPTFVVDNASHPDLSYVKSIFIPSNDVLTHSLGFLALNNRREIAFDQTYIDIVTNAELGETKVTSPLCKNLIGVISKIIDGEVIYQNDIFYVKKTSGQLIEFSLEASGYRKFGLLWKLLRNGLLEDGTVLFWDEPENSLNPELMPVLVDILLELQRGGVQIFLATHSEILASYFDVNRKDGDNVMFYSLYKDGEQIKADKSKRFDLLTPNTLTAEQTRLYEKELERTFGDG